jgi:hypothetical protein
MDTEDKNKHCSEYEQFGQSVYDNPTKETQTIKQDTWQSDDDNEETWDYEDDDFYTKFYGKDKDDTFSTAFWLGITSVFVAFFIIPYYTGASDI